MIRDRAFRSSMYSAYPGTRKRCAGTVRVSQLSSISPQRCVKKKRACRHRKPDTVSLIIYSAWWSKYFSFILADGYKYKYTYKYIHRVWVECALLSSYRLNKWTNRKGCHTIIYTTIKMATWTTQQPSHSCSSHIPGLRFNTKENDCTVIWSSVWEKFTDLFSRTWAIKVAVAFCQSLSKNLHHRKHKYTSAADYLTFTFIGMRLTCSAMDHIILTAWHPIMLQSA